MDRKTLEKWDGQLYRHILWATVFIGLLFVTLIAKYFFPQGTAYWVLYYTRVVSIVAVLVFYQLSAITATSAHAEKKVWEAIFNQMRRFYHYKSLEWGFAFAMASALLVSFIGEIYDFPAALGGWIVSACGIMSLLISALIYYRKG